jgi:hypothetical protein
MFALSSADPWALLGRTFGALSAFDRRGSLTQLPGDSLPEAVRHEQYQTHFLLVKPAHGVVQPIVSISIVAPRQRVVNTRWPVFFLEGGQNQLLVFGRLPETLENNDPQTKLPEFLVSNRGRIFSRLARTRASRAHVVSPPKK